MKPALRLVTAQTVEQRILAGIERRDQLRRDLAEVEEALAIDVREYSYAQGFKVPLRIEQAKAAIARKDSSR